jgi:hypothetical protein
MTLQRIPSHPDLILLYVWVLCGAVFVALSVLLGWNLYLVLSGQTTIESYDNSKKKSDAKRTGKVFAPRCVSPREVFVNEWDLGLFNNLAAVFGVAPYQALSCYL